jgi:hypothetical protein
MQFIARALKDLQLRWRREFSNLSQIESMVVLVIASRPGIVSAEIQDELNLDQPHASRILKKLISKRIVRSLASKKKDKKKSYYLEPRNGAVRFLGWIDCVLDELLIRNPVMLCRFVAALEDAPDCVVDSLEKAILQVKMKRSADHQFATAKVVYNLKRRNRSDHAYRKLFA